MPVFSRFVGFDYGGIMSNSFANPVATSENACALACPSAYGTGK